MLLAIFPITLVPLDLRKSVEEPGSCFSGEAGVIIRQPSHQAETVPAHGAIMVDLMGTAQHQYQSIDLENAWSGFRKPCCFI
jgi:hypothetical protein